MMTVFVDASVCHSTQAAGWGAWAKRDEWRAGRVLGSHFARTIAHSGEAELAAVANALYRLHFDGEMQGVERVMVQSDSVRALSLMLTMLGKIKARNHIEGSPILKMRHPKLTPLEIEALDKLREIQKMLGIDLIVKHVKGHTKGHGRPWVNRECDRVAKGHMRRRRAALRWKIRFKLAMKEGLAEVGE